jgi:uncharacterized protein YjiS (DUF1127 family)
MNIRSKNNARVNPTAGSGSLLMALRDHLYQLAMILENWRRCQQASVRFAHIDAHTLRDIGISEARRFIEINKPS